MQPAQKKYDKPPLSFESARQLMNPALAAAISVANG
jgi:hypothetical protein